MSPRFPFALFAATLLACETTAGNGVLHTEKRTVAVFEELEINTVDAKLVVDPSVTGDPEIEVTGDENLVALVRTRVDDGRLLVDAGDEDVGPRLPLRITVRVRALTEIASTGGSQIDVTMLTGSTLKVHAVGGSLVTGRGNVGRLDVELAGSARLAAANLVAKDVDLVSAGSSYAAVCATNHAEVELAGRSAADVFCHPRTIDRDVAGGSYLLER